jgi:adenosylmethionine-8-amino-7-oxononanoate aminotransferase
VGDVRGIGGIAAMEIGDVPRTYFMNSRTEVPTSDFFGSRIHEISSGYVPNSYFDSIGPRLYDAFLKRGLLLRPLGSILYFMPPYVITEQEVDWAFDQIEDVLREVDAG